MALSTVTIERELLLKLKKQKEAYSFASMHNLLQAMSNFFIENGLRPDEKVNYHLTGVIQEIKADFKNRDDSLRKWIGKISHVDLTSIHNDLGIIKELLSLKLDQEIKDTIQNNHVDIIKTESKKEEKETSFVASIQLPDEEEQLEKLHEKVVSEKNDLIRDYHNLICKMLERPVFGKNKDVVYLELNKTFFEEIKAKFYS